MDLEEEEDKKKGERGKRKKKVQDVDPYRQNLNLKKLQIDAKYGIQRESSKKKREGK